MEKTEETKTLAEKNITIRPRPRTFSKSHVPSWVGGEVNETRDEHDVNNKASNSSSIELFPIINNASSFSLSEEEVDECIRCWLGDDGDEPTPASFSDGAVPEFSPRRINQKIAEFSNLAVDDDVWDLAIFG